MKKILSVLAVASILFATSCDKKENKPEPKPGGGNGGGNDTTLVDSTYIRNGFVSSVENLAYECTDCNVQNIRMDKMNEIAKDFKKHMDNILVYDSDKQTTTFTSLGVEIANYTDENNYDAVLTFNSTYHNKENNETNSLPTNFNISVRNGNIQNNYFKPMEDYGNARRLYIMHNNNVMYDIHISDGSMYIKASLYGNADNSNISFNNLKMMSEVHMIRNINNNSNNHWYYSSAVGASKNETYQRYNKNNGYMIGEITHIKVNDIYYPIHSSDKTFFVDFANL